MKKTVFNLIYRTLVIHSLSFSMLTFAKTSPMTHEKRAEIRNSTQIYDAWQSCRAGLSRFDSIGMCATQHLREADKSLNHEYQILKDYLGKNGSEINKNMQTLGYPKVTSKDLINAQRQWLKFQRLHCKLASPLREEMTYEQTLNNNFLVHETFVEQANRASCLLELTLSRLATLEEMNRWQYTNGMPW